MQTNRTAIGVSLLQPYTIVAIATLKQYIGNIRLMRNVGQMIVTTEELVVIKTGYRGRCIDFISECRYWKKMWIDNINEYFKSRDLLIMNSHNSHSIIS